MNPESAGRRVSPAKAVVAVVAAGALVAVTVAGALLVARPSAPPSEPHEWDETLARPGVRGERAIQVFELTAADTKETGEAPALAADEAGNVLLAWASRTGENERAVFVARSGDSGRSFDQPEFVAKSAVYKAVSQSNGKTVTHEVKAAPHLAGAGPAIHLAWTEALPNGTGVRAVVAQSADRRAFGVPVPFHDGTGSRATYTALAAGPNGGLLAAWLDNRNGAQQCFAAERKPGADAFEPALQVHPGEAGKGVCPCCPTAALVGPDGALYVAFRNVANGYRDIYVGAKKPGANAFEVVPVVPPTWAVNGCPHDGPALARVGDTLHVAWMDARTGTPRCYIASAHLSDMKFAARELNPGAGGSQGNPQLFADSAGTLHAVWEESTGDEPAPAAGHKHDRAAPRPAAGAGRAVVYRALAKGATEFGTARAVDPVPGAFQTRPAITGTPTGEIVVAWNQLTETGKTVCVTQFRTRARR